MSKLPLNEMALSQLVDAFYSKVRADEELGPIFNRAVDDWPEHLEKLSGFWSSVMLASGRYKGQPVPAHLKHAESLTPASFKRWLGIWDEVTSAMMVPDAAKSLQAKAARIAESLLFALSCRPQGNFRDSQILMNRSDS